MRFFHNECFTSAAPEGSTDASGLSAIAHRHPTALRKWGAQALAASVVLGLTVPAHAEPEADTQSGYEAAADLAVPPQFSVNYQTQGGGFRDFGSIEGFVPLFQTPGLDVWFLQGGARLSTGGDVGSNLLLGYRTRLPDSNRLLGGYFALDVQGTDDQTFYQLGTGFERIGETWELRGNVYLPIGDRTSDTTLANGPFFQGNQLLFATTRQVAMAGGDIEVGGAIADMGRLGPLKAFGGLYYYGHAEVPGILGGRAWLAANPTEQLNLRLGIQHDGYFGTNLLLQTGFSWGGNGTASADTDPVTAALGQPVRRTMPIWLVTDDQETAAVNPATGQTYTFQHVQPGATGDGTFANPYGEVTDAVAIAADGGIVYVQSGSLASGFTIPAGVQVLSTGPIQPLATQFGTLNLPDSGVGELPVVPGTVVLSDRTRLSGFAIAAGAEQDGIQGNDIATVSLDRNEIQSARNGILLNRVSGTVTVDQNQILAATQNGVLLNLEGQTVSNATFTQNQVVSAGDNGFLIQANDASELGTLTLIDNQVTSAASNGVAVLANTSSQIGTANLAQVQILEAGANGLLVLTETGSRFETLNLDTFAVNAAGSNGLLLAADNGGNIGQARITNGAIAQSGSNGVLALAGNGSQIGPVTIANTVVEQAAANGLGVISDRGSTIDDVTLTSTQVTAANANGILVQGNNGSILTTAAIAAATIGQTGENGLLVTVQNGSQLATATLGNTSVQQATANGVLVQADGGSQINSALLTAISVDQAGENGVLVQADNGSEIGTATLQTGQVNTANQNGILILANNGSAIATTAIADYQIGNASGAIAANGILVFADNGAIVDAATIQSNQLQGIMATGIQGFANGRSALNTLTIQNNPMRQVDGGGVLVFADGQSQIEQATIAANQLDQIGREGIQVFADGEGQIASVAIADNTLSNTAGTGIQVFAGNNSQIDAVAIEQNELMAIGGDGITTFAQTGGRLPTVAVAENQVSQAANDGLRVFATNSGIVSTATLSENQTQTVGNTGVFAFADSTSQLSTLTLNANRLANSSNAVELGNDGSVDFCADIRDNISLDTANFDGNFFVNGTGALQIVDLVNINANNANTFDQINNAGAATGTSGAGACP